MSQTQPKDEEKSKKRKYPKGAIPHPEGGYLMPGKVGRHGVKIDSVVLTPAAEMDLKRLVGALFDLAEEQNDQPGKLAKFEAANEKKQDHKIEDIDTQTKRLS